MVFEIVLRYQVYSRADLILLTLIISFQKPGSMNCICNGGKRVECYSGTIPQAILNRASVGGDIAGKACSMVPGIGILIGKLCKLGVEAIEEG